MKRLLFLFSVVLFISCATEGQIPAGTKITSLPYYNGANDTSDVFVIVNGQSRRARGATLAKKRIDSVVNAVAVLSLGGGGGSVDTTSLSNRINAVNAKADTSSLSTRINTKVTLATYAQLRTMALSSTSIYITPDGGAWVTDATDNTSADDGGTILVNGSTRLKRAYKGAANITWFGIKGDNLTDNNTALNAALNLSYINDFDFPIGTYLTSGVVTISRGDFRWKGPGRIKLTGTGSSHVVFIDSVSNWSITGVGIRGNGVIVPYNSGTLKGSGLFIARKSRNWVVEDLTIDSVGRDGIYINEVGNYIAGNHAANGVIRRVKVKYATRNAISIISGDSITVEDPRIEGYGLVGIDLEPNTDNTRLKNITVIRGVFLSGAATSASMQASNETADSTKFSHIRFIGNTVYGNPNLNKSELRINNFPNSEVDYNTVYNTNTAISVTRQSAVRFNTIRGRANIQPVSANTGVIYIPEPFCTVIGNTIDETNGNGIYSANSDYSIFNYNVIRNVNRNNGGIGYGILVRGGLNAMYNYNTITDTLATPLMVQGIHLENGALNPAGNWLTKNTIRGYTAGSEITTSYNSTNFVYQNGPEAAFTAGAIPYGASTGLLTQASTDLFYDAGALRFGIGTNAPLGKFHVKANTASTAATNTLSSIFIDNSGITAGTGIYGANIGFNSLGSAGTIQRLKAMIAGYQFGSDADQLGLSFFIHTDVSPTVDLVESIRLSNNGLEVFNKIRAIHTPASATAADSAVYVNRTTGDLEMRKLPSGLSGNQTFDTVHVDALEIDQPSAPGYIFTDLNGDGYGTWASISIPVPDGDYGAILVSGGGASWTLTADALSTIYNTAAELKNKTINADSNTVTNLTPTNFKSGSTIELDLKGDEVKSLQAFGSPMIARTVAAPWQASTTTLALVDNTTRLAAVYLPIDTTITGIKFQVVTSGVFTSDQENRLGVYKLNLGTGVATLVASTTNDATGSLWKSSPGIVSVALSSPYVATSGAYYIAFIYNYSVETTPPALNGPAEAPNRLYDLDFPNSIKLFANIGGQNSLAASYTLSATSNSNRTYFAYFY